MFCKAYYNCTIIRMQVNKQALAQQQRHQKRYNQYSEQCNVKELGMGNVLVYDDLEGYRGEAEVGENNSSSDEAPN